MQKELKSSGSETLFFGMLHAQFSRVCRCPNAKTCLSVFARIKVDALGTVFMLSARVEA